MMGKKCKCGITSIRKFCPCGKEQKGDYFKCANCGEKTLEGYESKEDTRVCEVCSWRGI
jgi:formylmethanofuran dehydrogenase subunit E